MRLSTKCAALLAGTSYALSCQAAQAQTAAPAIAGNQNTSAQQVEGLQEVVVTAQRREESLQRTPIAITALSSSELTNRNIQTSQDLMQVTPGLQVSTQVSGNSSGSATFIIRGLGQERAGNGTSPAVAIYVDDFYYPSLQGSIFNILDLQQVEVLRGPQGTLFGRNTIGGAIRYTTKKPEFDQAAGYVQGTLGSYDRADFNGSLNLPLSDSAAVRLTAGRLRTDGYVRQQNGGEDAGASSTDLVRAQLRLAPSDRLDINIAGQYSRNELDGFPYYVPGPIVPIPGTLPFIYNHLPAGIANPYDSRYASQCDYCQAGTNKREFADSDYKSVTGTVAWRLSDALTVKSLTGWQRVGSDYLRDVDGSPAPINDSGSSAIDRALSQELQLNGNMLDSRLKWLLGGYYYDEKHTDLFPKGGQQTLLGGTVPPTLLTGVTKTKAGFADGTFKLNDRFSVLGGARYSVDDKSAVVRSVAGATIATIAKDFPSTTWRLGAQFQVTDGAMAYATVSRGFRAGGFAKINSASPVLDPFDPETATNYEVGARLDLFDRRLRVNPTVFYMTWDNIQVQNVVPSASGTQVFVDNVARAHSQGFELENEALITENLRLFGNLALLDIKYDEVDATKSITLNSHFERAPKTTYALGANYHVNVARALRLDATMNWSWQGTQYSTSSDLAQLVLPSYGLLNARLELSSLNGRWSIAGFVTNLTDRVYYVGGGDFARAGSGTRIFDDGRPREFGVSLRVGF